MTGAARPGTAFPCGRRPVDFVADPDHNDTWWTESNAGNRLMMEECNAAGRPTVERFAV